MDYGGFQRDFEGFRRGHGIGGSVSIRCHPEQPEIGSTAMISIEINGYESLWLNVVGHRCIQVSNGDQVRIPIGETAQDLILRDADGAHLALHRINPRVEQPILRQLELPAVVSYSTPALCGLIRAEFAQQVKVHWRDVAAGNAWATVEVRGQRFDVPIPRRETELLIGVELRSRHAHLSEQGIQRVERKILVRHPRPEFVLSAMPQVPRHAPAQIEIDVKWVTEVVVCHGAREQRYVPDKQQRVRAVLPVATDTLGTQSVQLLARSIDGGSHRRVASVEVLPRPVNCQLRRLADGSVAYEISGAQQVRLQIPSRCFSLDIDDNAGVIRHGFLMCTAAELCFVDDLGKTHRKPIVLEQARHVWAAQRPLPPVRGWRV